MLPFERKNYILKELDEGIVYISSLAEQLNVSEITIRRDLKDLEEEGRLVLLHGGGAKKIDTSRETKDEMRNTLFPQEKEEVGQLAASLVEDGDVIFIDSGTTNMRMVKHLKDKEVVIVTNGHKIIDEANKYKMNVTSVGGELKSTTYAFTGAITLRTIEFFRFDKCFLGVNGIDMVDGFSNADPNESMIKETLIQRSNKAYIMADESKFGAHSVFKFGNIKDATIITNRIPKGFEELKNIISVK